MNQRRRKSDYVGGNQNKGEQKSSIRGELEIVSLTALTSTLCFLALRTNPITVQLCSVKGNEGGLS